MRDEFIRRIRAQGFTPSLPPPRIVIDNPRSFGNYEEDKNILHISDWNSLSPQTKQLFAGWAKDTGGATPEELFEKGTHQWVFIHELGHWWQACQHEKSAPYAQEMGANRIAVAYWRERDPAFLAFMVERFQKDQEHIPSPVPAGKSKEAFLNANYNKLPGGPAYTWYQATMVVDADHEKPAPSFQQMIQSAGKPLIGTK